MKFKRTTLIAGLCLAVVAGLGLSRKVYFGPGLWLLCLLPAFFIIRRRNLACLLLLIITGLLLGLWRGGEYMKKLDSIKQLTGRKVTITAKATSDSIYSTKSQIEFTANNALLEQPAAKPLAGSYKISGFGVQMVYRGDSVRITGKLFPMRGQNQGRIAYAKLEVISPGGSPLTDMTRNFGAGMQNALPEPQASFALGLLVGQRNTLPADITAALTAVGLVHIIAVSGYNLTILVRAAARLRLRSKYQKLLLSLVLIAGFVLCAGFSASIIRAAVVSILGLWGWYYGREIRPIILIAFTAALTGLFNPFYVWGDLGWYLSFLAFFGVLVVAPIISARLSSQQPKLLSMVVLETLSAELMTLPLIMMTFGQLSIIALVANTLIVPLVPLAMLVSAAAAMAGALVPALCGWFAWPARLLLTYMLDIVHLLSKLPSALLHRSISAVYMVSLYALTLAVVLMIYKKLPKRAEVIKEV